MGESLAENRAMIELMIDLGVDIRSKAGEGTVELMLDLSTS